tara:strand:+ start:2223 stop:3248 length:1026 start_codon:yes stop_codon:yes gene_type:complete
MSSLLSTNEVTARVLKLKLEKLFNNPLKRKKFLIECLKEQGFIKKQIEQEEPVIHDTYDTCKICNSSSIIFSNHEKICENCGAVDFSLDSNRFRTYKQNINLTKGTFIEPGTTVLSINRDGKKINLDLSKINLWLSQDPEDQRVKKFINDISEVLTDIEQDFSSLSFDNIRNEILSMWYNLIKIKPNIKGIEKKSLMTLTIYYVLTYNNLKANIKKISSIIDVELKDVYHYNFVLKDIFSDTQYEKYININIGKNVDLELTPEITRKIKIVKKDLKDYLSNPLKDKELYGIIYFLGNLTNNKYTLQFLSKKSNKSPNIIANVAKDISNFYNKYPQLKERLN